MNNVVVIGVGNPYRRDDGAGIEVAHRLQALDLIDTEVLEHDGEPASLLDLWDDADLAYVIDSVRDAGSPGRVHRLEIEGRGEEAVLQSPSRDSSHALGLGDAVKLARVLDRLPRRLILLGIEGIDFSAGVGLSEEVARAATDVASQLERELQGGLDRSVHQ